MLNRIESDKHLRKIRKVLREKNKDHKIQLRKIRFNDGYLLTRSDGKIEIVIDFRTDVLSTVLHESLHKIYPNWSERRVLIFEKELTDTMTARQAINLLKIVISVL